MLHLIPPFRSRIKAEDQDELNDAQQSGSGEEDRLFNQNKPGTLAAPKWLRRALKGLRYLAIPLLISALAVGIVDHNRVATFWLCAVAFLALSACSSHAAFQMGKSWRQHWAVFFLVTMCDAPIITMSTIAAFRNQTAFALSNISGNVVLVMCGGIGLSVMCFDLYFKKTEGYRGSPRQVREEFRRNDRERLEMEQNRQSQIVTPPDDDQDYINNTDPEDQPAQQKPPTDRRGWDVREPKLWEAGLDRYGTVFIAALIFVFMGPLAKAVQLLASSLNTSLQHGTYHAALTSTVMGVIGSISLYVVDQVYRIIHPIDNRRRSKKTAWLRSTDAALQLILSGVAMGALSFFVIRSLDDATASMNVSPIFSGWFITPLFNTFPILLTMILSGMEGDLTLAIEIACALALQQLLFALPVIISLSWFHGNTAIALVDPALAFAIITGYLVARMSISKMRPTYADGFFLLGVWLAWVQFFYFYPVIGIFFTGLTGPSV